MTGRALEWLVKEEILVVEDSKFFASVLKKHIEERGQFTVKVAPCLAVAKYIIENEGDQIVLCLLDLHLPDAERGEIVDYVFDKNLPAVVFSSRYDPELHDSLTKLRILDYVLKDTPASLDHIVSLVHRIAANRQIKALVVEDSTAVRIHVRRSLELYQFQAFQAANGEEALDVLEAHPDISLIITDYQMPHMDGFELIKEVRRYYGRDELAIIGLSAGDDPLLSARFLKAGASDFLSKPFQPEEFLCRVNQNVEMIETLRAMRRAAHTDYLTGLLNRRRFFELAGECVAEARAADRTVHVAMIDIDHFKQVNDTYGHDAGDDVLKAVAGLIDGVIGPLGVVARTGGEEFSLLLAETDTATAQQALETLRASVEATVVETDQHAISVTISTGVFTGLGEVPDLLKAADGLLYEAKETGRNRIVTNEGALATATG